MLEDIWGIDLGGRRMDPETLSTMKVIVPATVSLVVAVIAMATSHANSKKLAKSNEKLAALTSALREEESTRDARRDYEYEALKRLYTQCEPLLFQFFELAEDAESRVRALARDSRGGNLRPDGTGWLATEGYYFNSTVYRFFAPLAAIRILQQRLTAVDLALDSRLKMQYRLLRVLYRSATEDQYLAHRPPQLTYEPDRADPEERGHRSLLASRPEWYVRQGMYRGTMDRVVDAMTVRDRDLDRVMSFSEFLQFKQDGTSPLSGVMPDVKLLLLGFHPLARPVLWRVLVAQKLVYDTLRASRDIDRDGSDDVASLIPAATSDLIATIDWRRSAKEAEDETIESAYDVAREYIVDNAHN